MKQERRELTDYGVAVKQALAARRMKQKELAGLVGISDKYLWLILYGVRPRSKYITVINRVLGLPPEYNTERTA